MANQICTVCFKSETRYLDHDGSAQGLSTGLRRIKALVQWLSPQQSQNTKQLLGFANCYRCLEEAGCRPSLTASCIWGWIGHTLRNITRYALSWNPWGKRKKHLWRDLEADVKRSGHTWEQLERLAQLFPGPGLESSCS